MLTLKDTLDRRLLTTHFQPIAELNRGHIVGYEALTRGPAGTPLESPRELFAEAARTRAILQLDEACWQSALDSAARQQRKRAPSSRLFLNALPSTLLTHEFERVARALIERAHFDPAQIVIEISEETRIDDFASFRAAISSFRMAGFGIAIDDAGAGHSGLQMMAEIVPDLIKIDAGLVREVDQHKGRRATVEALLVLARTLGVDVVAEGIERREELATLRDLGVPLGQGYLLARPGAHIIETIDSITGTSIQLDAIADNPLAADAIGRLAALPATIDSGKELSAAMPLFESQHVDGIVVLARDVPVGLVMKSRVFQLLGRAFGRELYLRRPVELVASRRPLIVDCRMPLDDVSRLAMARDAESLYDHIIVTSAGALNGIVSVQRLLAALTDARVDAARKANPLTGLPGNAIIERELRNRLRDRVALIHIDLDDFKAFNDTYGFHRGDGAITATAELLQRELDVMNGKAFLGHIGGDDFLAIVESDIAETITSRLPSEFAHTIAPHYDEADLRRGWIRASDRTGEAAIIPIMTLSLATVFVEPNDERHHAEILDALTLAKRAAKQRKRERRAAAVGLTAMARVG